MVGIWAKIKNGFNWVKDHIFKPVVCGLKKVVDNKFVKGIVKYAAPALNMVIPCLGTGIQTGFNFLSKAAPIASNLLSDHDKGGFKGVAKNVMGGKYNHVMPKQLQRAIQSGMELAKRPDTLHNRLQLRALPAPEKEIPSPVTPRVQANPRFEELN
jgi:hypothetical protein